MATACIPVSRWANLYCIWCKCKFSSNDSISAHCSARYIYFAYFIFLGTILCNFLYSLSLFSSFILSSIRFRFSVVIQGFFLVIFLIKWYVAIVSNPDCICFHFSSTLYSCKIPIDRIYLIITCFTIWLISRLLRSFVSIVSFWHFAIFLYFYYIQFSYHWIVVEVNVAEQVRFCWVTSNVQVQYHLTIRQTFIKENKDNRW